MTEYTDNDKGGPAYRRGLADGRIAALATMAPSPYIASLATPNPVAEELSALRDEIAALATSYDCISRNAVMAVVRTRLDRAVGAEVTS